MTKINWIWEKNEDKFICSHHVGYLDKESEFQFVFSDDSEEEAVCRCKLLNDLENEGIKDNIVYMVSFQSRMDSPDPRYIECICTSYKQASMISEYYRSLDQGVYIHKIKLNVMMDDQI